VLRDGGSLFRGLLCRLPPLAAVEADALLSSTSAATESSALASAAEERSQLLRPSAASPL
jgi:hypothetical protein